MEHFEKLFRLYQEITEKVHREISLIIEWDGSGCLEYWNENKHPDSVKMYMGTNFKNFEEGVMLLSNFLEKNKCPL